MKKLLICGGIILSVIVLLIILAVTVFSLKSAQIQFHNHTIRFAGEETQSAILENANFQYGKSVLFYNKSGNMDNLERSNPYLQVINIETVFPNTFVVHCIEREELYAVKFLGGYYICDSDLKILRVDTAPFVSTQSNLIELTTFDNNLSVSLMPGQFINTPDTALLKKISPAFELTNRDIMAQMALIKEIKIINTIDLSRPLSEINYGLEITDFNGLKTVITLAEKHLTEKINMFCACQSLIENPTTHYLYVYETLDGKIEAIKKVLPAP